LLTYFAQKYDFVDTVLGMLIDGGGVGLTLRGGRGGEWIPGMPENGHDANWTEMTDLLYLVQPVYAMLRNRKWTDYRQDGSVHRVEYGPGNHVQIDHAAGTYEVVVSRRSLPGLERARCSRTRARPAGLTGRRPRAGRTARCPRWC
jgi:hypothetical protein